MKKIMLVMTVLAIVAMAMTGCTERRSADLSPEQAAVVSAAFSEISDEARSEAITANPAARLSVSASTSFVNDAVNPTIQVDIETSASCGLGGAGISVDSVFGFTNHPMTGIDIDIDGDGTIDGDVDVVLEGHYRFFFEAGTDFSNAYMNLELGEYNDGLKMTFTDADGDLADDGFVPFSDWVNCKLKYAASVGYSATGSDASFTVEGSISGNKITSQSVTWDNDFLGLMQ